MSRGASAPRGAPEKTMHPMFSSSSSSLGLYYLMTKTYTHPHRTDLDYCNRQLNRLIEETDELREQLEAMKLDRDALHQNAYATVLLLADLSCEVANHHDVVPVGRVQDMLRRVYQQVRKEL